MQKTAGVSDAAVAKATGKGWDEWLRLLDAAGAADWDHARIAAHLRRELGLGGWWSQMVTVGYEQARGKRKKHQKPGGYEIGKSKTLAVPVEDVYAAWRDARKRARWMADPGFTIRKATVNHSLRITWVDGATDVTVNFYTKDAGKCQVVVQHGKLGSLKEAESKKTYWGRELEKLARCLAAKSANLR